jgi:methylmalonyl-CoA/ethylmalonyl-CoA epimerase
LELPLDHVAIAVPSLAAALPVFEEIQGVKATSPEVVPAQDVNVVFLGEGGTRIELLEPTSDQSTVHKFLERRGAGLHHIAYRVADIRSALARLSAAGFRLIDDEPRPGAGGHQVAFLHPHSTGGVLIELVEG